MEYWKGVLAGVVWTLVAVWLVSAVLMAVVWRISERRQAKLNILQMKK